jgi:hypothetical protein
MKLRARRIDEVNMDIPSSTVTRVGVRFEGVSPAHP